jgi:hypothetical protein
LQYEAGVALPPVQLGAMHTCVVGLGAPHDAGLVPSHSASHAVPAPAHFERVPCGCPPITWTQWPAGDESHAWH